MFGESYKQSTKVDDDAVEDGELGENIDEDGENDAMDTVLPKETPPRGRGKSGPITPQRTDFTDGAPFSSNGASISPEDSSLLASRGIVYDGAYGVWVCTRCVQ